MKRFRRLFSLFFWGGLGVVLASLGYERSGHAQAPAVCMESSTPLECYTAGLAQIAAARGDLARVQTDLTSRIAALEARSAADREAIAALNRIAAPRGSVLAFDLSECPEGWTAFNDARGRVILGATTAGQDLAGLSARALGAKGGSEKVVLTIGNIPEHKHATQAGVLTNNDTWGNGGSGLSVIGVSMGTALRSNTSPAGQIQPTPIDILPPFVTLQYCVRL